MLGNAAVYAVANLCQLILTIEFLGLGGTTELVARADQQLLIEFYSVPRSTCRRGTGRGGIFAR